MQKLISYIEMFLKQEVTILVKGDYAIKEYEHQIPVLWQEILLTDITIQGAVETIWQSLACYLPDMPKIIYQIIHVGLVVSSVHRLPIGLIYTFTHPKSNDLFSWLGYPPVDSSQLLQFEEKFGFPLPSSYQKFSGVHNGLVRDGWNSHGLRPVEQLYRADSNHEDDRLSQRLIAFSGDGAGNEQCYNLSLPVLSHDYFTVDLDHETRMLGAPQTFGEYFELLLKTEMGIQNP